MHEFSFEMKYYLGDKILRKQNVCAYGNSVSEARAQAINRWPYTNSLVEVKTIGIIK